MVRPIFRWVEYTMKARLQVLFLAWAAASQWCIAQPDFQRGANPAGPAPADPAIARAIATIEPAHIEQTIGALVEFGTRNTLTSMETSLPPGQGIEPAAGWIVAQFEQIS